jgi:hypothetical protein
MNTSLDFGNLLTRAWQITWRHKVLWIFGILAGLGNGGGGGGGGGNSGVQFDSSTGQPQMPPEMERFFEQTDPSIFIAIAVGLVCLGLIITVALIALQVIGRGGLVGGVLKVETTGAVTFADAWSVGLSRFVTLFLIGLLVGVVTFVLGLILIGSGALVAIATLGIGVLCLFPLICIFAIAAIVLNIIAYFAQIAAVVENLGVMDALRRAWEILRANVGSVVILGLILIVVGVVVNVILALPLLIVVIPAVFSVAFGFANDNQVLGTGGLVFALVCFCLYLPVLLVASGILETWVTSAWTLAYRQFAGQAPAVAPSEPLPPAPAPSV